MSSPNPTDRPLLLVAERDELARRFLTENLTADGYEVIPVADYQAAAGALASRPISAVVLELGHDTLSLIDNVRHADPDLDAGVPILALSTQPDALHRVRLLERGAADVMTKPFSYAELRLRLARIIEYSRARPGTRAFIQVGPLRIDTRRRLVTVEDTPVLLTHREYELLMLFIADPTRTFTRAELMQAAWGSQSRGRALDTACARLRGKLNHDGDRRFLVTIRGTGWRLVDPTQAAVWGCAA